MLESSPKIRQLAQIRLSFQKAAVKGLTEGFPDGDGGEGIDGMIHRKLSNVELVALLQYHALPTYSPKGSLKTTKDPISHLQRTAPEC
ncbi:hypothetical protein L2E82_48960 [Cichorium intybus]|uniref:Uncharacterized protein n=1 Tax=Cichorium intybus TaxID=13427 RepID=A0ACB8Z061_CICIN|nr:hypothetical protein L2E82_48960 [Cichorium intybus]